MSPQTRVRPRLLYLMHVDWGWIKLRPHFVAEQLAQGDFEVVVCFLPTFHRRMLSTNPSTIRRLPIPSLPRRDLSLARVLTRLLGRVFLGAVARRWKPDAVFLTHPDVYARLPTQVAPLPLFYDCMDLAVGFARNEGHRRSLARVEADLFARANLVFVPSESLLRLIDYAGVSQERLVLVRNGHPGTGTVARAHRAAQKEGVDLGFIGMIAEWVDLDLLITSLDAYPALRVHLWGPASVPVPRHDRLIWHGVVARDQLDEVVEFVDAFILPFKLTALTKVVDPVKMYEYVAWGRPVIAVYYPELDQFAPFMHSYRSEQELLDLLASLMDGLLSPPEPAAAREFLRTSTWEARSALIGNRMMAAIRGRGDRTT